MVKNLRIFVVLFIALVYGGDALACTSAIVSAAKSSEGVPLLWKHRDAPTWNCRVAYVEGEKYGYSALISLDGKYTYCGINERGFAVLNTVSHNIEKVREGGERGDAISLMGVILGKCATVEEFEAWLAKSNGKRRYVTNYAVGDPSGKAAYFEVSQDSYVRYDIEERKEGFDVRANYSFSGNMEKRGPSVPRYDVAMRQMQGKRSYAPHDFLELSRNYLNCGGGCVLDEPEKVVEDNSSIARYMASASAVMVCDAKNPRMLVAAGHPSAAMGAPVYVKAKTAIPRCVGEGDMLALCNEVRAKTYKYISDEKSRLNKSKMSKVLKVNTVCQMPSSYPEDIVAFNAAIDKVFEEHAQQVRRAIK